MRKTMVDAMYETLGLPSYVFQRDVSGYTVDSIKDREGAKWESTRYSITALSQCTCLGYLKFKKCKHLQMLAPEDTSWVKGGVHKSIVIEELNRLKVLCKDLFPSSVDSWPEIMEGDTVLPEYIEVLDLNIDKKAEGIEVKNLHLISTLKKFGDLGQLGVRIWIK